MSAAITTKFLGPTDTLDSRVKASAPKWPGDDRPRHSVTLPWDHRLSSVRNHQAAAEELARRLGWDGQWVGGETEDSYVFVRVQEDFGFFVPSYPE